LLPLQGISGGASLFLRGPLTAILPLLPSRLQLPIPLGVNLLLAPGTHVLRRDVPDGAVQTEVVVMLQVTFNEAPGIFKRRSVILTDERFLHFQLRQHRLTVPWYASKQTRPARLP
jgi:hypothetical protein